MSTTLTVSQLNRYIKSRLRDDIRLKSVYVKGEVSNFSRNFLSGHCFFSLKDEASVVRCVMFARSAQAVKSELKDGDAIVAFGSVDVYEKSGNYQIIVTSVMPLGKGALVKESVKLKEELAGKGYFNLERKKPLPVVPRSIGVVASLDSAALADVKSVLSRRYPLVKLFVFGAAVQGARAPESIAKAINTADQMGLDVIIIARGGGSAEDLSVFDTKTVADAVFSMNTPCVSAVGHETDVSIVDLTADVRAATPSAAAELCVPSIEMLYKRVEKSSSALYEAVYKTIYAKSGSLASVCKLLSVLSPKKRYEQNAERLFKLSERLKCSAERMPEIKLEKLRSEVSSLEALSPLKVLARGYSLVTDLNGTVITDADSVFAGQRIKINFSKGERKAEIYE